jgi:septal ring factor EnvC (AmiA/AmiB activator)
MAASEKYASHADQRKLLSRLASNYEWLSIYMSAAQRQMEKILNQVDNNEPLINAFVRTLNLLMQTTDKSDERIRDNQKVLKKLLKIAGEQSGRYSQLMEEIAELEAEQLLENLGLERLFAENDEN